MLTFLYCSNLDIFISHFNFNTKNCEKCKFCIKIVSISNHFQFIFSGSFTIMPTLPTLCVMGKPNLICHQDTSVHNLHTETWPSRLSHSLKIIQSCRIFRANNKYPKILLALKSLDPLTILSNLLELKVKDQIYT